MLSHEELSQEIDGVLSLSPTIILDHEKLQGRLIDVLIYQAHFAEESVAKKALELIFELAPLSGATASSIRPLYKAIGQGKIEGFTVPAFNVRTLTYETAQVIFKVMQERSVLPVIFELARSEMEYTNQPPQLFAASILAGAIKTGFKGPIFIQGDHYQVNEKIFKKNASEEIDSLKKLIEESMKYQIFNIDIDASTLVDLSIPNLSGQQKDNAENTDLLIEFIRGHQPKEIDVSIGAEIGHIGDRNSTTDDLRAFLNSLKNDHELSKISIQTGTSHGGKVLPDGSIQKMNVDFRAIEKIGQLARDKYHLAGVVQHGASTLPLELLNKFVEAKTLEIHLATHTQTIIFDNLPSDVLAEIKKWTNENLSDKRRPEETDEQFFYKNRKYALQSFKKRLWDIHGDQKAQILKALEGYFLQVFSYLSLFDTRDRTISFFT